MNKIINEWSTLIAGMVIAVASDTEIKDAIIESKKAIDKLKEEK